jgi:hypothetical protein
MEIGNVLLNKIPTKRSIVFIVTQPTAFVNHFSCSTAGWLRFFETTSMSGEKREKKGDVVD